MNKLLAILLLACSTAGFTQEHEILGYAPHFIGKEVKLYTYQEYITRTRVELGSSVVSPKDSLFHIPLNIETTVTGVLVIDQQEAEFYIAPNSSYELFFAPSEDKAISFTNRKTDVIFRDLDTTDVNYRIAVYHNWFDTFTAYYQAEIAAGLFPEVLDTFKMYAVDAYSYIDDEFFTAYVQYDIAMIDQSLKRKHDKRYKINLYQNYILPYPVYYNNEKYMTFLLDFYSSNFETYPDEITSKIDSAIYYGSPTLLMTALNHDLMLINPKIREMVMIDVLGKTYYERDADKRGIMTILDSLTDHAKFGMSTLIAANVVDYLTKLEPGYPAPSIAFNHYKDQSSIYWSNYEGKFVYFNVFETWNDQAVKGMKLLVELKDKYGEYISFLSVCTDDDQATFDKFMRQHPEMDWDIVYVGKDPELKDDWRIQNVPSYFLIDQAGFISLSPAPSPMPDGEYESIESTFSYIARVLSSIKKQQN